MIIVADANGAEVRSLLFTEYDFEIGDTENSFLVTCLRSEWETITDGSRIYIPGTEYGGLFKRLKTNTKNGTISVGENSTPLSAQGSPQRFRGCSSGRTNPQG